MSKTIKLKENFNLVDLSPEIKTIIGEKTDIVINWYILAKENLLSASIMIDNVRIPHAIFFIQQSIECLVKGIFLESGIIEEKTVKSINHNPAEIFKNFYQKVNYKEGLYYCEMFPQYLNQGENFEERLAISAHIANQFTTRYCNLVSGKDDNNIPEYQNISTLGLDENASHFYCHLKVNRGFYVQDMLLLLSFVFSNNIEQEVRYPKENNPEFLPEKEFNKIRIRECLPTIIRIINNILNEKLNF